MSRAPQGSEAWFLARCGRATASEFASVLAKGEGKTRAKYLLHVVAERLTGKPQKFFEGNKDTLRGQLQEPYARLAYEAEFGEPVIESDFIPHPKLMAGCSPDGLIGKDGGGEFKCVIPTVQLETWRGAAYPSTHKAQIQGNLWITERVWWDFTSFSPDMPAHLRLYRFRVQRDEAYIANLESEVIKFLTEVDAMVDRLMRLGVPLEQQLRESLVPA